MGEYLTGGYGIYLRHTRQKRFITIEPNFGNRWGTGFYVKHEFIKSNWYSFNDDENNGMYTLGPSMFGSNLPCSNFQLPPEQLGYPDVFHAQAEFRLFGLLNENVSWSGQVGYDIDPSQSSTNNSAVSDLYLSCGVTIKWELGTDNLTRDEPAAKIEFSWVCITTLTMQYSVLEDATPPTQPPFYEEQPKVYVWGPWQSNPPISSSFPHTVNYPSPIEGLPTQYQYIADSLTVPKMVYSGEGPGGQPNYRARYIGSIFINQVNINRVGQYHHA